MKQEIDEDDLIQQWKERRNKTELSFFWMLLSLLKNVLLKMINHDKN